MVSTRCNTSATRMQLLLDNLILRQVEVHPQKEVRNMFQRKSEEHNTIPLNPYDLDLIRAYGSIGFEIMEQVPDPDIILVPIGGGGLAAGIGTSFRLAGNDWVKIFGVEPESANVMFRSFEAGHATSLFGSQSIATCANVAYSGHIPYSLCKTHINDVLLVSDNDILRALHIMYTKLRLIVEPTGAVALAALLKKGCMEKEFEKLLEGKKSAEPGTLKIVAVVSGGNTDQDELNNFLKWHRK